MNPVHPRQPIRRSRPEARDLPRQDPRPPSLRRSPFSTYTNQLDAFRDALKYWHGNFYSKSLSIRSGKTFTVYGPLTGDVEGLRKVPSFTTPVGARERSIPAVINSIAKTLLAIRSFNRKGLSHLMASHTLIADRALARSSSSGHPPLSLPFMRTLAECDVDPLFARPSPILAVYHSFVLENKAIGFSVEDVPSPFTESFSPTSPIWIDLELLFSSAQQMAREGILLDLDKKNMGLKDGSLKLLKPAATYSEGVSVLEEWKLYLHGAIQTFFPAQASLEEKKAIWIFLHPNPKEAESSFQKIVETRDAL